VIAPRAESSAAANASGALHDGSGARPTASVEPPRGRAARTARARQHWQVYPI